MLVRLKKDGKTVCSQFLVYEFFFWEDKKKLAPAGFVLRDNEYMFLSVMSIFCYRDAIMQMNWNANISMYIERGVHLIYVSFCQKGRCITNISCLT